MHFTKFGDDYYIIYPHLCQTLQELFLFFNTMFELRAVYELRYQGLCTNQNLGPDMYHRHL